MNIKNIKCHLFALIGFVFLSVLVSNAISARVEDVRIAIVTSHNAKPYEKTLEGFMSYLKNQGLEYSFDVYLMEGDAEKGNKISKEIGKNRPRLIFTIGSLATTAVYNNIKDIPVISGVVLKESDLNGKSNLTGVSLEFPLEIHFQKLHRILPDAKNIGVIYNPKENQAKIDEARRIARRMGLKLFAKKANVPQDIPTALESLEKRADVLWAVPDKLVLNPQTAKHILLFSFRNRIPFIGLSSAWVKAGALYSLDRDYGDIGAQCGEMAIKVLQGVPAGSIKPSSPRKVIYSLNLKTADILRIDIPEKVVKGAATIFQGGN